MTEPDADTAKQPDKMEDMNEIEDADDMEDGDDNETPRVEELRRSIARKLEQFLADWRRCPRGACRRHRVCHAPAHGCRSLPQQRPMSEERWTREKAFFQRAVARELAKRPGGGRA